jgi:hypothetical protein
VNEKVFNILPRLVVCENGVVLAHGGPPAHKLNLEGLRGQHKIFDQEIVWADPADPKRIQELEQKDAEFRSVELPNLKKRLQDAIDKSLPNIYYEKKNQPIAQVQDAIRLFETRPEGIWFNTTRVEDEIFYEAIVKGMTQYSEKGLRKFLDEIGGNVMIRGHQTSVEVDGGAPNPFLSNILWTIHTSGSIFVTS